MRRRKLVLDARQRGVEVRPIDIIHSRWTTRWSRGGRLALRIGLRLVRGLANQEGALVPLARGAGPFMSVDEVWRRTGLSTGALERLADADAFSSLGLSRREALWAIRSLSAAPLPLFAVADGREQQLQAEVVEPALALEPLSAGRQVVEDYRSQGLSLRQHPLVFLRADLTERRMVPCAGCGGPWQA